jgi:two-component system, LytTR family, response regulator
MKKLHAFGNDSSFRIGLNDLLNNSVYIVSSTTNGKNFIELPKETLPDIIFCDSSMPSLIENSQNNSINNYEDLGIVPFIFLCTKVRINNKSIGLLMSANDYIIKPLTCVELFKAIEKQIEYDKKFGKSISKTINKLNDPLSFKNYHEDDRIFIDSKRMPKIIKIGDITYITSKGNDSIINLFGTPNLPVRKTLNSWEDILPDSIFKRINRSTIINLKFVESISRWNRETYIIYLKSIKEPFPVSYRYAREMRSEFK